jgi:4-carboxymuconolactone decarboxylase
VAPDDAANERRERGLQAYGSQLGLSADEAGDWFRDRYGDRFAEEAINAAGGAWLDDCLSRRDRSLIVVAALATLGGAEERLRTHVRWALEHGSSRAELEALVTLLAVYVGYPRASVAMEVVRNELGRADGNSAAN